MHTQPRAQSKYALPKPLPVMLILWVFLFLILGRVDTPWGKDMKTAILVDGSFYLHRHHAFFGKENSSDPAKY